MSETADELRARLGELVSALHDERWYVNDAARTEALIFLRKHGAAIDGMLARLTAAEAELALLKSEAQADADIAVGNFGMAGTIDDLRRLRELGERS